MCLVFGLEGLQLLLLVCACGIGDKGAEAMLKTRAGHPRNLNSVALTQSGESTRGG